MRTVDDLTKKLTTQGNISEEEYETLWESLTALREIMHENTAITSKRLEKVIFTSFLAGEGLRDVANAVSMGLDVSTADILVTAAMMQRAIAPLTRNFYRERRIVAQEDEIARLQETLNAIDKGSDSVHIPTLEEDKQIKAALGLPIVHTRGEALEAMRGKPLEIVSIDIGAKKRSIRIQATKLHEGTVTFVHGPSGSGKTSLALALILKQCDLNKTEVRKGIDFRQISRDILREVFYFGKTESISGEMTMAEQVKELLMDQDDTIFKQTLRSIGPEEIERIYAYMYDTPDKTAQQKMTNIMTLTNPSNPIYNRVKDFITILVSDDESDQARKEALITGWVENPSIGKGDIDYTDRGLAGAILTSTLYTLTSNLINEIDSFSDAADHAKRKPSTFSDGEKNCGKYDADRLQKNMH